MVQDYGGVLNELVAGTWRTFSGEAVSIPIKNIVVKSTLDGAEGELVSPLHRGKKVCVVSDEITHSILGERIRRNISADCDVSEVVLSRPKADHDMAKSLSGQTRHADALIAVGSGTVSDLVKYTTFTDGREYSVFPTSPMNAYTTSTASISFHGFKRSISAHSAKGVFLDLGILSQCPLRLIKSAFADVICRTTSEVDWTLSHLLFDSEFCHIPYELLALDEAKMIARSPKLLERDMDTLGALTRICSIMGLGTTFTGTTHSGSMAEHMMSHYIDMFCPDHPGSFHGEQVGVTTLTVLALQNRILRSRRPPVVSPTLFPNEVLQKKAGAENTANFLVQTGRKALDAEGAERLNEKLERDWAEIQARLLPVMLDAGELETQMRRSETPCLASEIGIAPDFYVEAVKYSRFIRDRFTVLDIAGDARLLDDYAEHCPR
ncbi:iron-containing alcohol dehydrogenase [Parasalinivibrio latis]|uniref:iron-containing alcohol dehydrogenase n=1 Tax=Parasalinivibrio latis TaxID=2952610 RepID=UPI0030DEAD66